MSELEFMGREHEYRLRLNQLRDSENTETDELNNSPLSASENVGDQSIIDANLEQQTMAWESTTADDLLVGGIRNQTEVNRLSVIPHATGRSAVNATGPTVTVEDGDEQNASNEPEGELSLRDVFRAITSMSADTKK